MVVPVTKKKQKLKIETVNFIFMLFRIDFNNANLSHEHKQSKLFLFILN